MLGKLKLDLTFKNIQFSLKDNLFSILGSNQEYDTRLIWMNNGSNKDFKHGKNNVDKSKTACIKNKNSVTSPVEGRELSYLCIHSWYNMKYWRNWWHLFVWVITSFHMYWYGLIKVYLLTGLVFVCYYYNIMVCGAVLKLFWEWSLVGVAVDQINMVFRESLFNYNCTFI